MFDCVRVAKIQDDFDYVRLPNPVEVNRTTGAQLSTIYKRSIDDTPERTPA